MLGVSALTRSGASPDFSNRDAVYNDVAAPGEDILSTFPRSLTAERPACAEQGYTPCASDDFRPPEGTSFAAPQVTAVAANLLGVATAPSPGAGHGDHRAHRRRRERGDGMSRLRPRPRSRSRAGARSTRPRPIGALDGAVPPRDAHEPNDDAGEDAYRLYFPPGEKARFVKASVDFWDDQDDVYAVYLRRGERLFASLVPGVPSSVVLALWRPGTASVSDLARQNSASGSRTAPGAASGSAGGRRGGLALPPGAPHRAEPTPPGRIPPLVVRTR